ncbi:hypothetical protein HG530_010652 [Fusarium avenaceum]|nr:hypothetical protein HG530_010652 [Fusarium avenaceum]
MASVEGQTCTVKPVVAVQWVDGKGFDHPTQTLGVDRNEVLVDPGSFGGGDAIVIGRSEHRDTKSSEKRQSGFQTSAYRTLDITVVSRAVASVGDESADIGERGDLGKALSAISALPETVSTSCTEVDDIGILWVNGETLAHSSAGHVAAYFEGEFGEAPGSALVITDTDGTFVGVPVTDVIKLNFHGIRSLLTNHWCTGQQLWVEFNTRDEAAAAAQADILPFQSGLNDICRSNEK